MSEASVDHDGRIEPWQIVAWPPVRIGLHEWHSKVPRMRPLGASTHRDHSGLRYGQAIWGADEQGFKFALAWDWREVSDGVATLLDPMSILSNVVLTDREGNSVSDCERTVYVNTSIYYLPWQDEVRVKEAA